MNQLLSVFVGLGANLDDPVQQMSDALDKLVSVKDLTVIGVSSLYRTRPQGFDDQPDFYNAVCHIETELKPNELLSELQRIENEIGRVRTGRRFGPRRIDLDILLYGQMTVRSDQLTIPHERLCERRFALEPLLELNPKSTVPGHGLVQDIVSKLDDQGVELVLHDWWFFQSTTSDCTGVTGVNAPVTEKY